MHATRLERADDLADVAQNVPAVALVQSPGPHLAKYSESIVEAFHKEHPSATMRLEKRNQFINPRWAAGDQQMFKFDFRNSGDDVLITTFDNLPKMLAKLRSLAMAQLKLRRQIAAIRFDPHTGREAYERFQKKK